MKTNSNRASLEVYKPYEINEDELYQEPLFKENIMTKGIET